MGILTSSDFMKRKGHIVGGDNTPDDGVVLSEPISRVVVGEPPEGYKRKDRYVLPNAPAGKAHAGVMLPARKGGAVEPVSVELVDGEVQDFKDHWGPYLEEAGFLLYSEFVEKDKRGRKKKEEAPAEKPVWKLRHPEFSAQPATLDYRVGDGDDDVVEMQRGVIETEDEAVKDLLIEREFDLIEG